MNLFDDKKNKKNVVSEMHKGSFEDLMKTRKDMLPEYEESIQKVFKDYSGNLVLIMRVEEDENADPTAVSTTVVGATTMAAQVRLIKSLDRIKKKLIDDMFEKAQGDPEAMVALALETIGSEALEAFKKGKK